MISISKKESMLIHSASSSLKICQGHSNRLTMTLKSSTSWLPTSSTTTSQNAASTIRLHFWSANLFDRKYHHIKAMHPQILSHVVASLRVR